MRNRIMGSIAAACFIVAALATPAAAGGGHHHHHDHGGPHDCPYNAVCFWKGAHFDGEMSIRHNPGPHCDKAPDWKIGSVVNNLKHKKVRLYKDKHCDYLVEVVYPGEKDKHLHAHSWL